MKNRIKEVRASEKLTQAEFADRLKLTRNFIAQVETGAKEAGDRTVRDICREFNVNEIWLRTGAGDMHESLGPDAEMAELVKQFLPKRPKSFQIALINTLLRFDPGGDEWAVLERIYNSIAEETKAPEE